MPCELQSKVSSLILITAEHLFKRHACFPCVPDTQPKIWGNHSRVVSSAQHHLLPESRDFQTPLPGAYCSSLVLYKRPQIMRKHFHAVSAEKQYFLSDCRDNLASFPPKCQIVLEQKFSSRILKSDSCCVSRNATTLLVSSQ